MLNVRQLRDRRDELRRFVEEHWQSFAMWRGTLKQREVANAASAPLQYISNVENGKLKGVGYEALERIVATYRELMPDGID